MTPASTPVRSLLASVVAARPRDGHDGHRRTPRVGRPGARRARPCHHRDERRRAAHRADQRRRVVPGRRRQHRLRRRVVQHRPPGGRGPGHQQTPAHNLLAYDIRTGELVTASRPSSTARCSSVAASPDGTRLYVGGDFTTVNGVARNRVAAFNTATGALVDRLQPAGVTSPGPRGRRDRRHGLRRRRLQGHRQRPGAPQPRRVQRLPTVPSCPGTPNADYNVWAIAVSGDGTWVFAGGSFQNVGGRPAVGLARSTPSPGAARRDLGPGGQQPRSQLRHHQPQGARATTSTATALGLRPRPATSRAPS